MSVPKQRHASSETEHPNLIDKDEFWKAVHEGFAKLRSDPAAWADYLAEAALWDTVAGDGLENEEPYVIDESGS